MTSQIMTKVFHIDAVKKIPLQNRILPITEEITGFKSDEFLSNSRLPKFVFIRHAIIHILYNKTSLSLAEIGALLGGKHHTTVIHSTKAASDLIATNNEDFINLINQIKKQLFL